MNRDARLAALREIARGFDTHDLDAVMRHFAADAVFGVEVRGCDLWTFRDRAVTKKDSYWKIRTE